MCTVTILEKLNHSTAAELVINEKYFWVDPKTVTTPDIKDLSLEKKKKKKVCVRVKNKNGF